MFCLVLAGSQSSVRAETIACDDFDYATTNLDGQSGGVGWTGAWFLSPLETYHNTIVSPGFTNAGLVASGNRMSESGNDNRTFRYLDTARSEVADLICTGSYGSAAFGKHGTTNWIAFLMNMTSGNAYCGVHLADDLEPNYDKYGNKQHQRIQMGRNNTSTNYYLGRVTNGGAGSGKWDSSIPVNSTVRLVVYRFDFKDPGEECWMWIDPIAGQEPSTTSAALHATNITHFCFNVLSVGGSAVCNVDELRIATSYAEAVPASAFSITTPSSSPGATAVRWSSVPGITYWVTRTSSLAGLPEWTNAAGPVTATTSTSTAIDIHAPALSAFYRVFYLP